VVSVEPSSCVLPLFVAFRSSIHTWVTVLSFHFRSSKFPFPISPYTIFKRHTYSTFGPRQFSDLFTSPTPSHPSPSPSPSPSSLSPSAESPGQPDKKLERIITMKSCNFLEPLGSRGRVNVSLIVRLLPPGSGISRPLEADDQFDFFPVLSSPFLS
jgi:hypothetical protein